MQIRPDWILHAKGGAIVLVAAVGLAIVGRWSGLAWPTITLLLAGFIAGASVEGAQAADNRLAKSRGLPLPHEVALGDLVASAMPCWVAAIAVELALRYAHQVIPTWLI